MTHGCQISLIGALVFATVTIGCEPAMRNPHDHGGAMVGEIRPQWKPVERRSQGSAVYVLWRWESLPPPVAATPGTELLHAATTTRPATSPPATKRKRWERAVEVEQVFVRRGQAVGFRRRRSDGQLIAVAGPTTRPLAAGHYCWHLVPGSATAKDPVNSQRIDRVLIVGAVVLAVAGVVAAIVAIDHNDHHAHLGDAILSGLSGGGD